VGVGLERRTALSVLIIADGEIAGKEEYLLPIVMDKWLSCIDAGFETQNPRTAAALVHLVQTTGQNLLLDPGGIASGHFPAAVHIQRIELVVLLVDRHSRMQLLL